MLQEVMLKKLKSGGSASDVHTETDRQECLQLLAQFLRFLQAWSTVGSDEIKSLEWFLVEIWWFRLDHFNSHDTQGPDIDLGTILLLLDNLGSHPVRSTHHGSTLRFRLGELGAESKIGCIELESISAVGYIVLTDFDITTGVKKNIVGLDITVNDGLIVQMLQSTASLVVVSVNHSSWTVNLTSRQIVEI